MKRFLYVTLSTALIIVIARALEHYEISRFRDTLMVLLVLSINGIEYEISELKKNLSCLDL